MSDADVARKISAILNAQVPDILAGLGGRVDTAGGLDRIQEWEAEDGWLISYSTARIKGGPFDGKFVVTAHKPYGKGARGGRGKVERWVLAYTRSFVTRRAAKARALQLYRKHSPKFAARTARQTG